ncbi:YNFM family putative membrane transporter [Bacillus ectoiniformans]|uniref:MFS transporter n=1 Tax=Bacillus ectoiniformans TaxID=1494429 RepID=UPI001958F44B|nr:MFS transporter [Bacillus ectoiniformans]MBM7648394.1 YNFM family putative membrane transporter [Bacillus ectoiniformans]
MSSESNAGLKRKYTTKDKEFWRMIGALVCASLITFANLYFAQPLMPVFSKEFSITPAESSLSLSLTVIALMAGLLIFGFLSDRLGRRKIMDIGLFLSMLPLAFMPFIDSFAWLLVLRFIQGFFIACIPAAAIAYVSEEVAPRSVGLGIILYIAANSMGGMLGRLGIGYIADAASWQTALLSLLGANVVMYILYLWWIAPSRYFEPSERPFAEDITGMLAHLKNRSLIPLFLAGIMLQMAFTGLWSYLPFYLQSPPFDWSLKMISFTYAAYFAGVVGSITAGKLSQSFPKTKLLIAGTAFFISGTLMTLFQSGTLIVIGLSLNCLGFFVVHSLMTAIVNERATHHKGGASSLYLFSYYFGVATGGTITAFIWQAAGWIGVVSLSLVLIPFVYLIGGQSPVALKR